MLKRENLMGNFHEATRFAGKGDVTNYITYQATSPTPAVLPTFLRNEGGDKGGGCASPRQNEPLEHDTSRLSSKRTQSTLSSWSRTVALAADVVDRADTRGNAQPIATPLLLVTPH